MAKHLRYLGMRRPSHDLGGKRPPEGGFPAHGPFEDVVPWPPEIEGIHLTRQKIAFDLPVGVRAPHLGIVTVGPLPCPRTADPSGFRSRIGCR